MPCGWRRPNERIPCRATRRHRRHHHRSTEGQRHRRGDQQGAGRVFAALDREPEMRAIILTGAGPKFFSAGWDLAAGEDFDSDYGVGGFGGFPELPDRSTPVIAAVNGAAVGGGFEIAMAADLIVAADHAQFWLPEPALGILPDAGAVKLPRLLAAARCPRTAAARVGGWTPKKRSAGVSSAESCRRRTAGVPRYYRPTRPHRCASSASIRRPVSSKPRATCGGKRRGKFHSTGIGQDPERGFRKPELGMISGDDQVGRHGDLEPTADCHAVDRGDHRSGSVGQFGKPAEAADAVVAVEILACRQVPTRREELRPCTGEDDCPHLARHRPARRTLRPSPCWLLRRSRWPSVDRW